MECAAWGFDSPPGDRFCGNCGRPLARRCPSCRARCPVEFRFCGWSGSSLDSAPSQAAEPATPGALTDPASYTPKHLREKILAARSALEGERKRATVLFADIKSSMGLAGALDPEEWHAILDRFFQILAWNRHGRVCVGRLFGTARDGGSFENAFVAALLTRGDHVLRYEFFDLDDTDRALARFDELCAAEAADSAGPVGVAKRE